MEAAVWRSGRDYANGLGVAPEAVWGIVSITASNSEASGLRAGVPESQGNLLRTIGEVCDRLSNPTCWTTHLTGSVREGPSFACVKLSKIAR